MALALGFVAPMALAAPNAVPLPAVPPVFEGRTLLLAQAEAAPPADNGGSGDPASATTEDTAAPVAPSEPAGPTNFSHKHQFGLSVMPGTGYRLIVPYDDPKGATPVECSDGADADRRVCTGRSPVFLDVQAAFGVSARVDLVVDLRFGIEKDFTRSRQFAVMPGLRMWMDQDVALKLYAMIQGVWDGTDQKQANVENTDFGFRPAIGLMYDIIRNVGLFGQLGATFGFTRWLRIEADAGAGVQVRFP